MTQSGHWVVPNQRHLNATMSCPRRRKGDGTGGDEGRAERRQDDVAVDGPRPRAERASRFLQARVEFLDRRHDGEDHARNGEIQVTEKQALKD